MKLILWIILISIIFGTYNPSNIKLVSTQKRNEYNCAFVLSISIRKIKIKLHHSKCICNQGVNYFNHPGSKYCYNNYQILFLDSDWTKEPCLWNFLKFYDIKRHIELFLKTIINAYMARIEVLIQMYTNILLATHFKREKGRRHSFKGTALTLAAEIKAKITLKSNCILWLHCSDQNFKIMTRWKFIEIYSHTICTRCI